MLTAMVRKRNIFRALYECLRDCNGEYIREIYSGLCVMVLRTSIVGTAKKNTLIYM